MEGFELIIKDQIIRATTNQQDLLSIILFCDKKGIDIHFCGNSITSYVTWFSSNLKVGDKLQINIVDVKESSFPQNINKKKDEELLELYNYLKNKLANEGLI